MNSFGIQTAHGYTDVTAPIRFDTVERIAGGRLVEAIHHATSPISRNQVEIEGFTFRVDGNESARQIWERLVYESDDE